MMTPSDHMSHDLSYFSGPSTSGAATKHWSVYSVSQQLAMFTVTNSDLILSKARLTIHVHYLYKLVYKCAQHQSQTQLWYRNQIVILTPILELELHIGIRCLISQPQFDFCSSKVY